jgi:hypothetical protein
MRALGCFGSSPRSSRARPNKRLHRERSRSHYGANGLPEPPAKGRNGGALVEPAFITYKIVNGMFSKLYDVVIVISRVLKSYLNLVSH